VGQIGTSSELWRSACRETAWRAQAGALLHPLAAAVIGVGAGLHRSSPGLLSVLVALLTVIAAGRLILIRRFDPIYYLRRRLWHAGFFGGALVTAALHGSLLGFLILGQGLTPISLFGIAVSMGIGVLAIVVYSQSLWMIWSFIVLIGGPQIVALVLTPEAPAWIPWFLGAGIAYFLVVARQQHLERWQGLIARYELTNSRDELEEIVADRTRELERTSRDYRQIFESAHDAIIVFRPYDERVLSVNRRACEIYGFTRQELLKLSLASISENVKRGQDQIRATLDVGVFHNFESVQYRKDGSRMFLEINASVIEFDGQRAILSINRDVTERRRAEALRSAKEAAERMARAKAQFLANMSHEIRTPMAGVVGLTDLLLGTDLDGQQAEYARLIQSSGVSLLRVIDDILDFSKVDAGSLTFEEEPFDLRAMLHEVVDLLRLGAVSNGTGLDLRIAEGVPDWVLGDPGRLRQVVLNLVGNAVKFTEGGAVMVEAELFPEDRIHIRVRDTGIGIAMEAQGRLFELFSQADDSTSRRFGGTGLGLAISKRIAEGMGGEIGFESAPGVGSTFWITVRLERSAPPAALEAPAGPLLRSWRILTAEDNAINQLVITEQLKALGYEVTAVGNGLEAVEAVQAGKHDLVLMDCQMPHLDGYEATLRIRQLPGAAGRIPIVALTAHAIREDLDKCLEVGMNDTLTKPFSAEALRRKLARWLGSDPGMEKEEAGDEPKRPGETQEAGEALDLLHLERLRAIGRESDPDLMARIVEQFRTHPYLDEIRGALERGDLACLKARAHGLKGTSSLLGAIRLPRLCAQLELLCTDVTREECREECLKQLALIESEHRRVLSGLADAFGPEVEAD
jgi:PAS domain S-box-containing protein